MAIIIDEFRLTPLPRGWVCHACGRDADSKHVVIATATCRFAACALWKARRELRRAIRARRGNPPPSDVDPLLLPLLLALLLLAGCTQPPPVSHADPAVMDSAKRERERDATLKRIADSQASLADQIARMQPAQPQDLTPVLDEIRKLKDTRQPPAKTDRGWSGIRLLTARDDRWCAACQLAKADIQILRGSQHSRWRFGTEGDEAAHVQVVYLDNPPDGGTPVWEIVRDGQVIDSLTGYQLDPGSPWRALGVKGEINRILQRHPGGTEPTRVPATDGIRRVENTFGSSTGGGFTVWGNLGSPSASGILPPAYGSAYGSSYGGGYGVTSGYGSTGGEYTSGASVGGYGYGSTVYSYSASEGGSFAPSRQRFTRRIWR